MCLFGVPCKTVKISVQEKNEVRRKMLTSIPIESFSAALYVVHWIGPIALVAAVPLSTVYTVISYVRMMFV